MSLVQVNPADAVKNLYLLKLKTLSGAFISMIILQMIGILITFSGYANSGIYSTNLSVQSYYYSSNLVIILTLMWGLISSILITTRAYRYDDFSFVTNRITSHFANILFLLTSSLAGGLGAVLSGFLLKT